MDFSRWFQDRHGYPPFPWQEALAQRLARGDWPDALTPPTGAGKTTLIDVWLWARLAGHPVPRRLTYIIDRRVVVDGVEDHARGLADSLPPAERPTILLLSKRIFRHEFLTFTHLAAGYPCHIAAPCETGAGRSVIRSGGVRRRGIPQDYGLPWTTNTLGIVTRGLVATCAALATPGGGRFRPEADLAVSPFGGQILAKHTPTQSVSFRRRHG